MDAGFPADMVHSQIHAANETNTEDSVVCNRSCSTLSSIEGILDDQLDLSGEFEDDTEWWETEMIAEPWHFHLSGLSTMALGNEESTTLKTVDREHTNLLDSVEWLGNHVCHSVLNVLANEVQEKRKVITTIRKKQAPQCGTSISNPIDLNVEFTRARYQEDLYDKQALVQPAIGPKKSNRRSSLGAGWAPSQSTPVHQPPGTFKAMKRPSRSRQVSAASERSGECSAPDSKPLPSLMNGQQMGKTLGDHWMPQKQPIPLGRADDSGHANDPCDSNGVPRVPSSSSLASQVSDLSIVSRVSKKNRQSRNTDSLGVVTGHGVMDEQSLGDHCGQANTSYSLPYTTKHRSALLFVDISGFTALSQVLGPDLLSKTINAYFELIVNEVVAYKGDVLKFAGDALFAAWYASGEDDDSLKFPDGPTHGIPQTVELKRKTSLADCVAVAAMCGANIVAKLSDFAVHGATGVQVATLNVRCGLGAGNLSCIHVGDDVSRREYLFIGDPIDQASEAESQSAPGELMASHEAFHLLKKRCRVGKGLAESVTDGPTSLARKSKSRFVPLTNIAYNRQVTYDWKAWDSDSLDEYRRLISLYVNPVVLENEKHALDNPHLTSRAEARHREEAELRSVYVMFISMPDVMAMHTGDESKDHVLFQTLNDIMKLTSRELDAFSGHFRQFIFDDKGLLLIATFGLRGSTFPNMIADRALPATCKIQEALLLELGIRSEIGATIGNAYCGVVGGIERHEYTVLGPSINLAARLMASPFNPGFLVDDAVRLKAGKCYKFKALNPIEAKGYQAPVPIFEPLSSYDTRWKRTNKTFVGRQSEINQLSSLAKDIVFFGSPAKLALVSSPSGKGKSTFVAHAISHLQQVMRRNRKRVMVTNHACKEGDQNIPLCMFRSVLVDVLAAALSPFDDKSKAFTDRSRLSWLADSIGDSDWESSSKISMSVESLGIGGVHAESNRFLSICAEVGVPREVVHLIGHHLLGMNLSAAYDDAHDQIPQKSTSPTMQTTIEFVVRVFQRCTERIDLVVIAVDDVHRLDEMSWMILQRLFETEGNVMIVCTSLPPPKQITTVSAVFWDQLNEKYSRQGRFVLISLKRFNAEEMRTLVAKHLGCDERELCDSFLNDIFTQSGGMPHFATEILECVRRKNLTRRLIDGCIGWEERLAFASVGELILHRIDSYDANVRYVLRIGAVFGESFASNEIVEIFQRISDIASPSRSLRPLVQKSLDFLVAEGVLSDVCEGGVDANAQSAGAQKDDRNPDSMSTFIENRSYSFCHDIWRSTKLSLMLDDQIRSIHRVIAQTLEGQQQVSFDYLSRLRLFGHWKASGESSKAANLALSIGKSFEELGLSTNSVRLYEDALDMWRQTDAGDQPAASIPPNVLETIDVTAVEDIIRLYVAIGKCGGNLGDAIMCVTAYQNALETLQESPAGEQLKDRSIVFPIFSGIFLAIKFGQIEQDSECTYEQNLVANFVNETRLHGDPVHYLRALSMQSELYGRMGKIDAAFEAHEMLEKVYDVEMHSAGISKSYGSDRAGQSFGRSALLHMQKGNQDEAMRVSRNVIYEMLPKMDRRNVHNALMMMYPVIWIMKELGAALEVRSAFHTYLVRPFEELWENGTTFGKPLYVPIMMLLDLVGNPEIHNDEREVYVQWALHEENLRLGEVLNSAWAPSGRYPDAISAEICLLLAKQVSEGDVRSLLLQNGFQVIRALKAIANETNMTASFAYGQLEGLHLNFSSYAQLVHFDEPREG